MRFYFQAFSSLVLFVPFVVRNLLVVRGILAQSRGFASDRRVRIIDIAIAIAIVVSGKRLDPDFDFDFDFENLRQSNAASKLDSSANILRLRTF
ncbi:MAG: hypothetical protein WBM40_00745 [Thiohalocapsa sp.]